MNNINRKTVFCFILSFLAFSSCSKKSDTPSVQNNQAIMKMEVSCSGDLGSQVAVLTFLAVDNTGGLINIVNDSTGAVSAGPFFQNSDFPPSKQISFHSVSKVASVSVMLSIAPKIYATTPDQDFTMTIKIYFDDTLKDNQTFYYDQLSGGNFTTPKDFDYKVTVH
jgi:hypothetical protein